MAGQRYFLHPVAGIMLAILPCGAVAQPAEPLGLRGAIADAVVTSPKLRAAEMEAKAAETGIMRQMTGYLPVVSLGAGITRGNLSTATVPDFGAQIRRTASLNLSMPVFSGGVTYYGVRSAQSHAQAARAEESATRSDLALEVAAAYLQYLLAERTTSLLATNTKRMTQLLTSVKARRTAGFASDADVLQVDAELAWVQQQLAEARTMAERARASAESLAGRKIRFVQRLPKLEGHLAGAEDGMAEGAARNNPRVNSARHASTAAEYASRAAFGKLLPQVDFTAKAERDYDHLPGTRPRNWQVGLQLTVPLLDAGSALDYRQRREAAMAVRFRADEAQRQTQEQTRGLWREYRGSAARLTAATRRAGSYAKIVDSNQQLFATGMITIDALLEKYRLWNAAEVQREQVAMQRYVTLCQLLAVAGKFDTAMLGH